MENIFKDIPSDLPDELIEKIAGDATKDISIERIISRGHASPQGFWYDPVKNEFVILLKGKAGLIFKGSKKIVGLTPEAMEALLTYSWPGNVRQLRNAVEKMVIFSRASEIGYEEAINALEIDAKGQNTAAKDNNGDMMSLKNALHELKTE